MELNFSIKKSEWMDDETKDKALKKLNNIKFKIGHSDKLKEDEKVLKLLDMYINNDISLIRLSCKLLVFYTLILYVSWLPVVLISILKPQNIS